MIRLLFAFVPAIIVGIIVQVRVLGTICPIRASLGIPCPACGSTRAAWALLHLDLNEALVQNALLPLGLLILFWALLSVLSVTYPNSSCSQAFNDFSGRHRKAIKMIALGMIAIYMIYWIWRLIRFFPHTEPMTFNFKSIVGRLYRLLTGN